MKCSAVKVHSDFGKLLGELKGWLGAVALFSCFINLLALTGSIFMLQVYDRVLTSRSLQTLVALMIIAVILYAIQGGLDVVRARILVRIGSRIDEKLSKRAYDLVLQLPLRVGRTGDGLQPVRDVDSIRGFMAGQGPSAIMDLPWIPIYLVFVFLLHPLLGLLSIAGAFVLIILTIVTEFRSREPVKTAGKHAARRQSLGLAGRRNAEVLRAMGFGDRIAARWQTANSAHLEAHENSSDVTGGLGAISKVFRALLQSAMLALGAWLTVKGEMSGGAIIASSITSSRALAPIEAAIGNWKSFVAARDSRARLAKMFGSIPAEPEKMALPKPEKSLVAEGIVAGAPGSPKPIIRGVSLQLEAGQGVGVIGPSGSGKSTLVRALVGVWPLLRGAVRIDGASLDQWNPVLLGPHIGYLPQDIELFDGTIAENIARFAEEPDSAAIIAAARTADIHELILRLPGGYDASIGEDGTALSAGQRQRIGLARALYGDPFLVVLDEPNSNLDAEGEAALTRAIHAVRSRGGIVIVVAHRPSAIVAVDLVAMMQDGMLQAFGPKNEVLSKVAPATGAAHHPPGLAVVPAPFN